MIPKNLHDYYKLHAKMYDVTRWAFLFGRNSVSKFFPVLPKNPSILDFGCGTGLQLKALTKNYPTAKITGIDQSADMLNIARRKLDDVKIREEIYTENSFSDDSFDLIVASYSLSMVKDLPSVLKSFNKHLKLGGFVLVIDFDATPYLWFNRWMKVNHVLFEDQLFKNLQNTFEPLTMTSESAYFGLYSYSTFLGRVQWNKTMSSILETKPQKIQRSNGLSEQALMKYRLRMNLPTSSFPAERNAFSQPVANDLTKYLNIRSGTFNELIHRTQLKQYLGKN